MSTVVTPLRPPFLPDKKTRYYNKLASHFLLARLVLYIDAEANKSREEGNMNSQALLVGVESILHNYISVLFKKHHIELKVARDRREADAWLKNHTPDLIVTQVLPDSQSPRFEFCKDLASVKNTPLVVMTASPFMTGISLTSSWGTTEYVEMPFHPDEFMTIVKGVITKHSN